VRIDQTRSGVDPMSISVLISYTWSLGTDHKRKTDIPGGNNAPGRRRQPRLAATMSLLSSPVCTVAYILRAFASIDAEDRCKSALASEQGLTTVRVGRPAPIIRSRNGS